MSGPLAAYRALLIHGAIHPDPVQAMAVEKLESLAKAIADYNPNQGQGGWLGRFGFGNHGAKQLAWLAEDGMNSVGKQGLYLYGDVGKGKSMLMDLFFGATSIVHKQRVHFHEFMRDVQARLHALRQDRKPQRSRPDSAPRRARSASRAGCSASTNCRSPISAMQ